MTDHTPSALQDQRPPLELTVDRSGKVRLTVDYDPSTDDLPLVGSAELVNLCRQASSIVTVRSAGAGFVAANQDRSIAREQDNARHQIRLRRIGRLASHALRKLKCDGDVATSHDVRQAQKLFGEQFGMSGPTIDMLMRNHNRHRDQRYRRMRDRIVARLYSDGRTYEQIGHRFEVSAKTAAKWTKDAVANIGNRDKDPASDPGNPLRKAS